MEAQQWCWSAAVVVVAGIATGRVAQSFVVAVEVVTEVWTAGRFALVDRQSEDHLDRQQELTPEAERLVAATAAAVVAVAGFGQKTVADVAGLPIVADVAELPVVVGELTVAGVAEQVEVRPIALESVAGVVEIEAELGVELAVLG